MESELPKFDEGGNNVPFFLLPSAALGGNPSALGKGAQNAFLVSSEGSPVFLVGFQKHLRIFASIFHHYS